jgi:hypothetical protein
MMWCNQDRNSAHTLERRHGIAPLSYQTYAVEEFEFELELKAEYEERECD